VRHGTYLRIARAALSLAAIAAVTALIELLDQFAPVISLGPIYLLAIVPIAIAWGLVYAIPASIVSMLCLNFFFLPPLYTFTLADSRNWAALAVYVVVAIVVSELAVRMRRRAAEAEQRGREETLLAGIAASLLEGRPIDEVIEKLGGDLAAVLRVEGCRIELGAPRDPPPGESPYELRVGDTRVGTLYLLEGPDPDLSARNRFLPALASLLAVAIERERLVREAVEAEAFKRSDSVKTAVLRSVSHDLRSPLTAIRAAGGTLRRSLADLTPADRDSLLDTVCVEAERLERIVANLMDLSRLQAGAADPEREVCPLDELLGRALAELGPEAQRIEVSIPEDAPLVEVDPAQLDRVLVNLLENALRFSPASDPVHVRVTQTRRDALVRVVDRGSGIPEDQLERIFEPFRTAAQAADSQGSGLGLAIARGFAEANGGRVWAESRPGQGASFVLALPLVPDPAAIQR
jgi:two-component system sensor histidine kinase KdpD